MSWVTITLSPDAKHALKWLHTWLGIAGAGAALAYEHLDIVQDFVSPKAQRYFTAIVILLMVYNSMRAKNK